MVDHLENRALDPALIQREDAQRDEAHMANAREGDEALDVLLGQGHVGAVDDGDHRNHQHGSEEELHGVGKYGERDPQKTIGAHLEEDPSEDDAPRCRGLGMGVREPSVDREHGYLDREGGQKGDEEPRLKWRVNRFPRQFLEVHRAEGVVDGDHGNKHQNAAGQREEQKLDRGVDSSRASPHADQQKDGNHYEFPEHKEEEEVRCGEKPDHRRLRDQESGVELPHPGLNRGPRGADAQDAQQRGEEDEWDADPIHAHAVGDVPGWNPFSQLDELQSAGTLVERAVKRGRDRQSRQGCGQRDPARQPVAAQEQDQNRPRKRQERRGAENGILSHRASIARTSSTTIPSAMIRP